MWVFFRGDCCPFAKSCQTLWNLMDCSTLGSLSFPISWSLLRFMSTESVMLSNHLILHFPLFLLPSICPSIRVFSNEPVHWFLKCRCSLLPSPVGPLPICLDSLTIPKHLTVWITTNCGKFLKRGEYQTTWPDSWETCIQVRKKQLEPNMEQTGSKSGKKSRLHIVTLII